MITNREEVIDKAFKVFLRMNYEKASISTLAKACGVVKIRIRVDARITVHHIVADQKAVTLADVVCQRPGCRAGNIPVSYKHLAVYKRQDSNRLPFLR